MHLPSINQQDAAIVWFAACIRDVISKWASALANA